MPRARGIAYPINKRTSHVFIQLDTIDNMPLKKSKSKNQNLKTEDKKSKMDAKTTEKKVNKKATK